jgi:peptidoglycan-associated lipoprotein
MRTRAIACMLSFGAVTCAKSSPAPSPPPAPFVTPTLAETVPDKSPNRATIDIADEIRRACGIADADAHFAFDSAYVRSNDYPALDKLVACFRSGPLASRNMRLIGHADPRGDEEYNLVLAGSRADGVKIFLLNRGLSGAQMHTLSRGEMDARGVDEGSWAADRRVDIELAN